MKKERLKGFLSGVVAAVVVAGFSMTAFAASRSITVSDGIRVVLNGQNFQPKDGNGAPVELFSYKGTIYAPVRAICEAAGMKVSYDSNTQTATITSGSQTSAAQEPSTSGTLISEERAKQIALDHAKVSAANASFTEIKLSQGFGTAHYDLDFYSGTTEYDYEIDAVSGNVIKFSSEHHASQPNVQQNAANAITSDRAKEIALERAPGATVTKCKLDHEDGRQIYEIEMRNGFTEYECEIDAISGTVLKWEIDD